MAGGAPDCQAARRLRACRAAGLRAFGRASAVAGAEGAG